MPVYLLDRIGVSCYLCDCLVAACGQLSGDLCYLINKSTYNFAHVLVPCHQAFASCSALHFLSVLVVHCCCVCVQSCCCVCVHKAGQLPCGLCCLIHKSTCHFAHALVSCYRAFSSCPALHFVTLASLAYAHRAGIPRSGVLHLRACLAHVLKKALAPCMVHAWPRWVRFAAHNQQQHTAVTDSSATLLCNKCCICKCNQDLPNCN